MNNISLVILKSFHILVIFFMAVNYAFLTMLIFSRFDFFRGRFFRSILHLIFVVMSPIYTMLDKIIKKTVFGEKVFLSRMKDLTLAFVLQIILYQIDFFIKNSI